jgi:hypothetical protein
MCGLFGGAGPHLDKAAVDRIVQLGIVSQLRGLDSTGILSCFREDGKIHFKIIKDVMHSTDFLNSRKIRGHLEDKKPFVIAGHCRAATVGAVNYDNAHPFGLGKILGMKNGTVPSIRGKKPDETDSKAMLRIIQDEGVEEAVRASSGGGYAVVWADSRDLSLNFLRNIGRPLYIMTTGDAIYWASEYDMLHFVRSRTGMAYDKNCCIECVPTGVHRKYILTDVTKGYKDIEIKERRALPYNVGQKPTEKATTIVVSEVPKAQPSVPITIKKPAPAETALYSRGNIKDDQSIFKIQGFKGKCMKPAKAKKVFERGCAYCNHKISLKDAGQASMMSNTEWLCMACSNDPLARLAVGAHNRELYRCKIIDGDTHGSC